MPLLTVRAGAQAYRIIQQQGLRVDDIAAVFAASGAAKWLTISALDGVIFGDWLQLSTKPIHLFGTSVGAWKLAAAAQNNPKQALADFAQAYCLQRYDRKIDHQAIQEQSDKIIASILSPAQITQILSNPQFRYHCGAVRCRGIFASERKPVLAMAMLQASLFNLFGRRHLSKIMERVIFFDQRSPLPLASKDGIPIQTVGLTPTNFVAALSASGSIPYLMAGIQEIAKAPAGMYRDGGLVDYHPLPDNLLPDSESRDSKWEGGWHDRQLILYPHFYPAITPGWFDKSLPWRKARADQLDNVVLISPSPKFINSLPNQRIPDRQDFKRFSGRNDERIALWQHCIVRGQELGAEFMEIVNSSRLKRELRRF